MDQKEVAKFKSALEKNSLRPVVVHLSYLPNPAAADDELYEKSVLAMGEDYRRAVEIDADFFVVHPGNGGKGRLREDAVRRVAEGVKNVLTLIPGRTVFLLENQAGGGTEVAGDITELGAILKEVGMEDRTGICLDTCHAFAAGYELRTEEGWNELLTEIEEAVGLSRLCLLHINDSLGEKGSHLDRHTHVGEGKIGLEGFRLLLSDPRLADRAGILETPRKSDEEDLRNLAVIRGLSPESAAEQARGGEEE